MTNKKVEEIWAGLVKDFLKRRFKELSHTIKTENDLRTHCLEVSYERYLRENFGFMIRDWKLCTPVLSSITPDEYSAYLLSFSRSVDKIPDKTFSLRWSHLVDMNKFTKFVTKGLRCRRNRLERFTELLLSDKY